MRDSSSGDQMAGGGHLRDAGDPARRVVQSVTPGATYIDGGELKGGGRSSGLSGNGVAGTAATAQERAGGQRGNREELMGVATLASGSSGRRRRRRIDSGGPRWPRRGKTSGRRFGASPVV